MGWRRTTTAAAVAAASAGGAVAAGAAIPGEDDVTGGCHHMVTGQLRLMEGAAHCHPEETYISWNREGRQGAAGAAGPAGEPGADGARGPEGPVGPTGPQGLANVLFVDERTERTTDGYKVANVLCPDGMFAVSGGGHIGRGFRDASGTAPAIQSIGPISVTDERPQGWSAVAFAQSGYGDAWELTANALCADRP